MADKEKRRSGATPPGMPEGNVTKSDSDREFLSRAGVGELLRGAILKMVEARSDDPIGFLADHFCNLASVSETGTAGYSDVETFLHTLFDASLGLALWIDTGLRVLSGRPSAIQSRWKTFHPIAHAGLQMQYGLF